VKAAAIFEATLTTEQTDRLAALMREHVATRPAEVELATLVVNEDTVRLIAYWSSVEALDAYLATGAVPRGTALMREVGAEPTVTIARVPQFA
jgi:membrane carboxypeptidase/penicillin-binding protein PbpC